MGNVVEGVVAVTAGLMAGRVSLVGFGFDSGIESAASVLVGVRLAARLRHGGADEAKERRALKAGAVTFFVLAAYVTFEGTPPYLQVNGLRPRSTPIRQKVVVGTGEALLGPDPAGVGSAPCL